MKPDCGRCLTQPSKASSPSMTSTGFARPIAPSQKLFGYALDELIGAEIGILMPEGPRSSTSVHRSL